MTTVARLFWDGVGQAVRLPKEFRFEGDEVCVKRVGDAVILYPMGSEWALMDEAIGQVDEDFMADRNQPREADRQEGI